MTSLAEQHFTRYIYDHYQAADLDDFVQFTRKLFDEAIDAQLEQGNLHSAKTQYDLALSLWHFVTDEQQGHQQNYHQVKISPINEASASGVFILSEDKAFIVDSINALLLNQGHRITQLYHPRIKQQGRCQSFLYIELASLLTTEQAMSLKQKIITLLTEVEKVTEDFLAMQAQTKQVSGFSPNLPETQKNSSQADAPQEEQDQQLEIQAYDATRELQHFFEWLGHNNFIFLGYQALTVSGDENAITLEKQHSSALGLLALTSTEHTTSLLSAEDEQALGEFASDESTLLITKSSQLSNVHRHDYYDQISVKQFNQHGQLIAMHYWLGLFTQRANAQNPREVPYIRNKLKAVLAQLSAPLHSHTYRKIEHILEALPKRELYESNVEQLYQLAKGIYRLNGQNQSGTFVRENANNQQVSVLVFVGKDVFCTDLRDDIESLLCHAYQGSIISRHSMLNDNALAQWHFVVARTQHQQSTLTLAELVAQISAKTKSWHENLTHALFENFTGQQAQVYAKHYAKSFSKSYREKFTIADAITDIGYIEKLTPQNPYQFHLAEYKNGSEQISPNMVKLNIYSLQQKVALSESIPILENLGFRPLDEFSFANVASNSAKLCADLYTYTLECREHLDIAKIKSNLESGLEKIWLGDIENDGYNKLLIAAQLDVRQIVIIRAYGKYLRQLGLGYSDEYFQQALVQHPELVKKLVSLFELRFALNGCGFDERDITDATNAETTIELRNEETKRLKAQLLMCLNDVAKTDHDRILRNFIAAICATVRTNFYQKIDNGEVKPYCSFKIKTSEIDDAPEPRPYVETFIYSPKVEGVHLRFAPVSRGGLRWSDRPEDFRTEVLGLVKAQQVKNVVIVPQGAKGTFVPKQLPEQGSREEITTEAITCYKMFISGLLDITDNNSAEGIVKPRDVICFDGDDSYLVVAADKGTATFSDIANQVALDYGFWLGDAFASGGSVGYDHKKMGITAKGAWVSVQRHFREIHVDVQTDAIKVAGIGDMSGDVFGNGMLLSNSIELIAAFDHRDIFIDPTPNAATSFAERQRLFNLPRSSWRDYKAELISKGGDVFSRHLKKITLTPQIKQCLGIDESINQVSPDGLIRYILTAHLDLLWFGGIGTYVKASNETHIDISDKANDTLRINGNQLNCKVIGEGGNLGCSQLARIEFAKKGGRVNTDAVDNSAGVNCSDNEVNIKILLNGLVQQQKLTMAEREQLLEKMTDDVAQMVLKNNYYQAQALSLDEANSHTHFDSFTRLTHYLVNSVSLNRELEFLPDDEELQSRSGKGLTRPELAVLMAYSKMDVHNALLKEQHLLTDPYFNKYLLGAFPKCLVEPYLQNIFEHSLAKPIVATLVANEIFNRGGIHAVREQTGASIAEIVKAFIIAKEIFNLDDIWQHIEQLEGQVSAQVQIKMMIEVQRFYRLMAIWFVNHADAGASIEQIVHTYRPGIAELQTLNSEDLTLPFTPIDNELYQLGGKGQALVEKIHQLKVSSVVFCDIVKTANELHLTVKQVLSCFSQLGQLVDLSWFIEQTDKIKAGDHWSRLARFSLLLELLERREKLVVNIIKSRKKQQPEQTISNWGKGKRAELQRIATVIDDLKNAGEISLDKLFFANRQIGLLLD